MAQELVREWGCCLLGLELALGLVREWGCWLAR